MSHSTDKAEIKTDSTRAIIVAVALMALTAMAPAPSRALTVSEIKATLSVMSGTTGINKSGARPSRRAVSAARLRRTDTSPKQNDAVSLMRFHRISLKRLEAVLAEIAVVMPYVNLVSAVEMRDLPRDEREALTSYLERARDLTMKGYKGTPENFKETAALLERFAADINQLIIPRLQPIPIRKGRDGR